MKSSIRQGGGFGTAQVILALSIGILVVFVAFPVILIFINAFWDNNGNFNLTDVVNVLKEPDTYQALLNSVIIAIGTTVGSTTIGTFFAWLVTRTDLPYKRFMKGMFLVPFMNFLYGKSVRVTSHAKKVPMAVLPTVVPLAMITEFSSAW